MSEVRDQRASPGSDSNQSAATVFEERGDVDNTDVVQPCMQGLSDAAPSTEGDVAAHGLLFPLKPSDSSEDEEFCMFARDCSAQKEDVPFLSTIQHAFESSLSAIGEDMTSNVFIYDEMGSSFDAFYGESNIRSTDDTLPTLRELQEADIFVNRYRIEPGAPSRIWRRFAIDTYTRQKVTLRFYPNSNSLYKAVSSMHDHLAEQDCVCRLLDTVEGVPGFPPCHVLERGDFTLTEVMKDNLLRSTRRSTILYNVIKVIEDLHRSGIVHGDVTPEEIVWLSAEKKWKLANLETSRWTGKRNLPASSLAYAAPEVFLSTKRQMPLSPHPSADMWSVGIIAHELLTGDPFFGPTPSTQRVADVLSQRAPLPEVQARSRSVCEFLHGLLSVDRRERLRASDALQSPVFDLERASVINKAWGDKEVRMATGRTSGESNREAVARLRVSIRIERFRKSSTPSDPFHLREAKDVLTTTDSGLPNETIHIMRLSESHRLRIHIEDEQQEPLAIGDIDSVTIHLPDARPFHLPASVTKRDRNSQEIVALLDPTRCDSEVIHRVSPSCCGLGRRYTQLNVQIGARHADDEAQRVDLEHTAYCKMIHPNSRLRLHRLVRATRGWCSTVYQQMRDTAQRINSRVHK